VQQRGKHELDSVGAELGHDGAGSVVGGRAHVLIGVAETEEHVRQNVYNVGLKETAEHVAEHLEGKEGALAMRGALLVLQERDSPIVKHYS
jgi:hypothetical protein